MFRCGKNFISFTERAKRVRKYCCKRSRRVNRQFFTSSSKERRRTICTHIAEVFSVLFQALIVYPRKKDYLSTVMEGNEFRKTKDVLVGEAK